MRNAEIKNGELPIARRVSTWRRTGNARRGLLCACAMAVIAAGPSAAPAALKVVTTTTDLRSIVESVGGDHVKAASLSSGHEDPHFIDAKPSCMVLAQDADLWVRVGMELEIGYENLVIDGSRNPKIRIGTPGHTGRIRRRAATRGSDRQD